MTETKKIDLRRELKHLYRPPAKEVVEVEVPKMSFLRVDGEGDPNTTSEAFREATEALYSVAYAVKFAVKREQGIDYGVMPLEGLWWTEKGETDHEEILADREAHGSGPCSSCSQSGRRRNASSVLLPPRRKRRTWLRSPG